MYRRMKARIGRGQERNFGMGGIRSNPTPKLFMVTGFFVS